MSTLPTMALSNALVASILALCVWLLSKVCRRPALIHSLWVLVLIKLITPPLFSIPILPAQSSRSVPEIMAAAPEPVVAPDPAPSQQAPPQQQVLPIVVRTPSYPSIKVEPWDWEAFVLRVWLLISGLLLLVMLWQGWLFRCLIRRATPASADLIRIAKEVAGELGLRSVPGIRTVPGRVSPLVWALGKPCILLPVDLLDRLTSEQQRSLLTHEMAHIRRRDHLVRALELIVIALFWWHPLVWWARRRLQEVEEQCCDAWVLSTMPTHARDYAMALVKTLEFLATARATVPIGASGLGRIPLLKRRVSMIMNGKSAQPLSWWGIGALFVLGGLILPLAPVMGDSIALKPAASKEVQKKKKQLREAELQLKKMQEKMREQMRRIQKLRRSLGVETPVTDPLIGKPPLNDPFAPAPGPRPTKPAVAPVDDPALPPPFDNKAPHPGPEVSPFDDPTKPQRGRPRPPVADPAPARSVPVAPRAPKPAVNPFSGTRPRFTPPRGPGAVPPQPRIAPATDTPFVPSTPRARPTVPGKPVPPRFVPDAVPRRTESGLEKRVKALEEQLRALRKELRKRR